MAPVQIQGPKSAPLMEKMFGPQVRQIPYYGLLHATLNGHAVTISRTGFSAEIGFEIYLHDAMLHADDVWPHILEQGEEFNLRVIAPSHIRRLEAGILSYGQDLDIENNPYEVRLGWQVDLNKRNFIGKDALARIKAEGVTQRLVGLKVGGEPITWYNEDFYLVKTPTPATTWATSPAPSGPRTSGRTLPWRSCRPRIGSEAPGSTWGFRTTASWTAEVVRVPILRPDQAAAQDGPLTRQRQTFPSEPPPPPVDVVSCRRPIQIHRDPPQG